MAVKIQCDRCQNDLSETEYSADYMLSLCAYTIPQWDGEIIDVDILPPIKGTKYFCGLGCLQEWAIHG